MRVFNLLIAGLVGISVAGLGGRLGAAPNPILTNVFTADPAPLVHNDTLYLYVGHDEAKAGEMFSMWEWLCYSTKDLKTWTPHGSIMRVTDFKWATRDAWAAQVVERNGKFYLFATVQHDNSHGGKAIGVAVSDHPTGPFVDARGSALIRDDSTPSPNGWDDIDPTVLIDDDGTAWMAWGNPNCYLVKLKPNLTELDGAIQRIPVPNYTEGPWLHKRGGLYYLSYAAFAHQGMSEKIGYATATNLAGPWTYRGVLTDQAKNSYTIHPGIIEFQGQSYLFYHNATLTLNGERGALGRRSVCVEYLHYRPDGTIEPIQQTVEGVSVPPLKPVTAESKESPTVTSAGVVVTQNAGYAATNWPGQPLFRTVGNPYYDAPEGVSFSNGGGATNLAQTFTVAQDARLQRISLFAGDGFGSGEDRTVTLALYDLGTVETVSSNSYAAANNLFGSGLGLTISYEPQAPGLLTFDFTADQQVMLKPGRVYAFELQGIRKSAPLFWRKTRKDTYSAGAAFSNRAVLLDRANRPCDFALALYGAAVGSETAQNGQTDK